jgi:hypothetical protein
MDRKHDALLGCARASRLHAFKRARGTYVPDEQQAGASRAGAANPRLQERQPCNWQSARLVWLVCAHSFENRPPVEIDRLRWMHM